MLNAVFGAMSCDMAIDMGTFHTRIHVRGRGLVCRVPSVVAILRDRRGQRRILGVGEKAWAMLGRTPDDVQVVRPIRDGLIDDFEVAEALLRHQLVEVQGRRLWVGPRVAMCIPYGTTEVEKRAVRESAEAAGGREVFLVEHPLATAAGTGLPIEQAVGRMVVDIGGGSTDIAVISLGGIVYCRSIKVGGDHMDLALIRYLEREKGITVGIRSANTLKEAIGTAVPSHAGQPVVVKGRDLNTGFPRSVEVTAKDVGYALTDPVEMIVEAVIASMEHTPPDLAADIAETGIVIAGGAAKLDGLDRAIGHATGMAVVVADDPECAAVRGAASFLEDAARLREAAC
jgi:rod shape-determining protein MreB